jgi:MFS family permease
VVFGAPVAGAWADRHDRKRTMIVADFLSGCLTLLLMFLLVENALQLPLLIAIVGVFAFISAFHGAAFDTSYAMIVPEPQLPRANGMMQTIWSLSGILSPMIAASIISIPALARQGVLPGELGAPLAGMTSGVPLAIGVDALTFFFAAAVPLFLYVPSPKRADLDAATGKSQQSLWSDIRTGAQYIWDRRPLLWLLGTFAVANLTSGPIGVFQPMLVKFNLAADWGGRGFTFETALATLATVGAVGGVAGGVFISAWGGLKRRRVYGVIVSLILSGLTQIIFGLSDWFFLAAAMLFVFEGMIPIMNSHSQTIWQTQTPRELQGRVFSVRRLIAQFTWPLSTALAGWAGGVFDPGMVIAVLGAILTVFCVAQLFNPYLLRVEDKAYLDELADRRSVEVESTPSSG